MESFLEILKYTIPALVVFATAYIMMKEYLEDRQKINYMAQRTEAQKITLPVRLQAYERMMLLCDRVSVQNLLLRIRMPDMTVAELRAAMLIAVRQEFDHNTSQQLYVSDTLWKIISIARDETLNFISDCADGLDPAGPDLPFVQALLAGLDAQNQGTPLLKAMNAIRTEAGKLF